MSVLTLLFLAGYLGGEASVIQGKLGDLFPEVSHLLVGQILKPHRFLEYGMEEEEEERRRRKRGGEQKEEEKRRRGEGRRK